MAKSPDTTEYFNSFYSTGPGLGNASSYQVSGTPWVTGSTVTDNGEVMIEFPAVTKNIVVLHRGLAADTDTDLRVHFRSKSDASAPNNVIARKHYISIDGPLGGQGAFGQLNIPCKCKRMYISSAGASGNTARFEIQAELTGIAPGEMFELTGSGITS
tara:strand:+ start:5100 stop:5573 length:474 start_codon:yes stop_codon:yes gene_type:complete